jgi:transposase
VAAERTRPDVVARRAEFLAAVAAVPTADLVFLDECGVTTALTRHYARARRGERAMGSVPHGHWKVLTVLGAISISGVVAAMTVDAATDSDVFRTYVAEGLAPALRPGQVVVLDNLPAHKAPGVREALAAVGCRLLYLPPYAPDLNPIEMAWAKVKGWLRSAGLRTVAELERGVGAALDTITAQDARGFVRHCGYTL